MLKKFLSEKKVYEITKFTTLDFKNHLSCIFWFTQCNMRCPYCYNKKVVEGEGIFNNEYLLNFLKSRVNKLDGVVLSGGECTFYQDLKILCHEIKKLGFDIKIDTNGLNTEILRDLIDNYLVDFIALDYKAPYYKYKQITKTNLYDNFSKTLDILIKKKFNFEVRTTVHSGLLTEKDINNIILDLKKRHYLGKYYIQNYLHVEDTFDKLSNSSSLMDTDLLSNDIPICFRN